MGELAGKVAVITGAGSGIARACARVFAREGACVLGADITGREREAADELGDSFVPFHADVTRESDVVAMFEAALAAFGRVDIVGNIAGVGGITRVKDVTVADYRHIMDVNLLGVVLGTKHAVRTLTPSGGGVILNMASTGGVNGSRVPTGIYGASKAAVISLTKQTAIESANAGIRANAICPGFTVTELSGGRGAVEASAILWRAAPMARPAEPEEIAEVACFVASDRASFVTGAVIPVDGGMTATMPS